MVGSRLGSRGGGKGHPGGRGVGSFRGQGGGHSGVIQGSRVGSRVGSFRDKMYKDHIQEICDCVGYDLYTFFSNFLNMKLHFQ